MTFTRTATETFTRTSAKHVASKVAADLRYMQALYGTPTDGWIEKYNAELVELLVGGYLDWVIYGMKRNEKWVVAIKYVADASGNLTTDQTAGKLPFDADVANLTATSYLSHTNTWNSLSVTQQAAIEAVAGFSRTSAPEPGIEGGHWESDRTYSHNGGGVRRSSLRR